MRHTFVIAMLLALLTTGCGGPTKPGATASPGEHQHAAGEEAHGDHQDGHGHEEGEKEGAHPEGEHDHGEGESGHGDEEEGLVALTEAQREEIGLQVITVEAAGDAAQGGSRTGKIEADPDRRVIVTPQVSGTIRHLPVIVGSRLKQGDIVAVLDSPEVSELKAEYHNARVELELAAKELANKRELVAVGDESRRETEEAALQVAEAKAKRDAAAARLEAARLAHQRLATLKVEGIASTQQVEQALAERKALEADVREAKSAVTIAEQHLERERRAAAAQLREKAETFPAEAALARAQESIKHFEERLRQLGSSPGDDDGSVTLTSPIDGQVVQRPVTRGERVTDSSTIAVLVDPSEVWVWIDLLRGDLATVDVGDQVTIRLVSDPTVQATGTISHIEAQVETATQTVRARVSLREPGGKFRVGSFVNASLSSADSAAPVIPQDAVQEVEGQKVVYKVDPEGYRRTPVQIIAQSAKSVSVSGLEPGARIVVKGATDLKAMDLASTIGGHSH